MRTFRHLTIRYMCNRIALLAYEKANPNLPWLTREMVDILDTWLRPTDIGLEFGSGRSTNWFASRVKYLTSVEDNPKWYEIVQSQVQTKSVRCLLHEDGSKDPEGGNYVAVAKMMSPSSLDFCLIDGAARGYAALACLDKLKPGGILIIDNVERYMPREPRSLSPNARCADDGYASEVWMQVGEHISNWRYIWTSNGVTDTAFWIRPLE